MSTTTNHKRKHEDEVDSNNNTNRNRNNRNNRNNNNNNKKPFNKTSFKPNTNNNTKSNNKFNNKFNSNNNKDDNTKYTQSKKKQKTQHNPTTTSTTTTTTSTITIPSETSPTIEEQTLPIIEPIVVNKNWDSISKKIAKPNPKKQNKATNKATTKATTETPTTTTTTTTKQPIVSVFDLVKRDENAEKKITKVLSLDCEMVEVTGRKSALGSVSIVNSDGITVYKSFVKPMEQVTDYRTRWSGLTFKLLEKAPAFLTVQKEVSAIIKDKILVGHDIKNDLSALMLTHPPQLIRDSIRFPLFIKGKIKPSLKGLTLEHLGAAIQDGPHSSEEDALANILLYQKFKKQWEMHVRTVFYPKKKTPEQRKADREKKLQSSEGNTEASEDIDEELAIDDVEE